MAPKRDITGQTFGFLKAIKCTDQKQGSSYIWEFECTLCGKHVFKRIGQVTSGQIVSCGCFKNRNLTTKKITEKLGLVEGTNLSRIKSDNIQKNNTSGHRGVSYTQQKNKSPYWAAYIYFKGHRYHLGCFKNIEDAIEARKNGEEHIFGNFLKWYSEVYPKQL